MSIIINDPELESLLEAHAVAQPVPTTKGRLLKALAREALAAARATNNDVVEVIRNLRANGQGHTPTKNRRT